MTALDAAIFQRRAERMLAEFGLTRMFRETIKRERMLYDDKPAHLNSIEREGLMVVAEMRKGKH